MNRPGRGPNWAPADDVSLGDEHAAVHQGSRKARFIRLALALDDLLAASACLRLVSQSDASPNPQTRRALVDAMVVAYGRLFPHVEDTARGLPDLYEPAGQLLVAHLHLLGMRNLSRQHGESSSRPSWSSQLAAGLPSRTSPGMVWSAGRFVPIHSARWTCSRSTRSSRAWPPGSKRTRLSSAPTSSLAAPLLPVMSCWKTHDRVSTVSVTRSQMSVASRLPSRIHWAIAAVWASMHRLHSWTEVSPSCA